MGIDSKHVCPGILKLGDGEIALGFVGRAWDDFSHDLIIVHLPGWTQLFGEWQPKFADNGNDFDIEILGFGYTSVHLSDTLADGFTFSKVERERIEALCHALFADCAKRQTPWPFKAPQSRFLGNVVFAPGWIREE